MRFSSISTAMIAILAFQSHAAWAGTEGEEAPSDTAQAQPDAGDIIVTAQKRAERLEDVPIAIASIAGETLVSSGINASAQLPQAVPGLRMDFSGAFVQPTIRGIGSSLAGAGLNANIATYVDGFYQPSALTTDFQFLSVTNVSVLKGPQGTLFGRNATGGAIQVTTADPDFRSHLTANLSYARFNALSAAAYGTTALSDKIAVNVAANYERGDGYIRNIVTGDRDAGSFKKYAVRTKALFQLSDDASLILTYQHSKVNDPSYYLYSIRDGLSQVAFVPGGITAQKPYQTAQTANTPFKSTVDLGGLKGTFDLGFATLTSYTMYRKEKSINGISLDGSNLALFLASYIFTEKTFTQELNLTSSSSGPLTYIVGFFYYSDINKSPWELSLGGAPLTPGYYAGQNSKAYSLFGDATYQLSDQLFITAGLRYDREKRSARYETFSPFVGPLGSGSNAHVFRNATPRAVVRYQLSDRANIYASYAQGFKSGLFNPQGQNVTDIIRPEKIHAFEVGFKSASSRVRFNTSAFYYKYSNLQVASYETGTATTVRNAGKAEIYGADADISASLNRNFEVRAGAAYTHARYKEFNGAPLLVQCLDPSCGLGFGGFPAVAVNAAGNQMPRSPTLTANLGLQYEADLSSAGSVRLNADSYYTSRIFFDPVEQFYQKAYALLNLRATWESPGKSFTISVFGNNVTGTTYVSQVVPNSISILQNYGPPRTYGLSLTYKY